MENGHFRADDGWLHCPDETRSHPFDTPSGAAVEVRCPHVADPLRYELVDGPVSRPRYDRRTT